MKIHGIKQLDLEQASDTQSDTPLLNNAIKQRINENSAEEIDICQGICHESDTKL